MTNGLNPLLPPSLTKNLSDLFSQPTYTDMHNALSNKFCDLITQHAKK